MFIKYDTKPKEEIINENSLILPDLIKKENDINKLILLKKKISKKYFKEIINKLLLANLSDIKNLTLESIEVLVNNNKRIIAKILKRYYGNFTDQKILKELSENPNPIVRLNIAANKNCTLKLLLKLYKDENKAVKREAYLNIKEGIEKTNATSHRLVELKEDLPRSIINLIVNADKKHMTKCKYYTAPICGNLYCPIKILEKFNINDMPYRTKKTIARNKNSTAEILQELINNDDGSNIDLKLYVSGNENCSSDLLEQLAKHKSMVVRRAVAKNINCPISLLDKLSDDEERYVRENVAEHKNCSLETLKKLCKDKDEWVSRAAFTKLPSIKISGIL